MGHLPYTKNYVQVPAANSNLPEPPAPCPDNGRIPTVPASPSYSKDQTSQNEWVRMDTEYAAGKNLTP